MQTPSVSDNPPESKQRIRWRNKHTYLKLKRKTNTNVFEGSHVAIDALTKLKQKEPSLHMSLVCCCLDINYKLAIRVETLLL